MTTAPHPAGSTQPAGLYIHIPFCVRKCRYCDFYSVTDTSLATAFVLALLREMTECQAGDLVFDTLYMGGGTPSVLPPAHIQTIVDTARNTFQFRADAEITLELNPGTITRTHLDTYIAAGINRLNVGIQSFQPDALSFLGRCHTVQDARQALSWAQSAGFENIGLDLIYGIPDQTRDTWRLDLQTALSFKPAHLSCYMLTYESGTPLYRHWKNGHIQPLPDTQAAELFQVTTNTLTDAGYQHYEISNFARSRAQRSRHNQKYWYHVPYLGFGPAAHSFTAPVRRWNTRHVTDYMDRIQAGHSPEDDRETLTREQLMIEAVYLGLRTSDGIGIEDFDEQFGIRFTDHFDQLISELAAEKLLTTQENRCALTPTGMLHADGIAGRFTELIE